MNRPLVVLAVALLVVVAGASCRREVRQWRQTSRSRACRACESLPTWEAEGGTVADAAPPAQPR